MAKIDLEEKEPTRFDKLVAFAERHIKVITFLVVVLVIIAVIGVITYLWRRSVEMRAKIELGEARTIEELKAAESRYRKTSVYPSILYRLANKYQEEGQLEEAKKRYEEFISRYKDHFLYEYVTGAYNTLCKNLEWLEKEKESRLAPLVLSSHPINTKINAEEILPKLLPATQIEVFTSKGRLACELYDNEAPYTVANFVALIDKGYYNGVKFTKVDPVQTLIINPNVKIDYCIPWEITGHDPKVGNLAMTGYSSKKVSSGGDFQIYLRDAPELKKEHAVFGIITEGIEEVAKKLTSEDTIINIVITRRAGSYLECKRMPHPE
jgi:peptidyl-prolyl cis-trans isomerase B (cyclophilin B)